MKLESFQNDHRIFYSHSKKVVCTTCKTHRFIKPAFFTFEDVVKNNPGISKLTDDQSDLLDPSLLVEVDTDPRPCLPPGRSAPSCCCWTRIRPARSTCVALPPPPPSSLKFTFDFTLRLYRFESIKILIDTFDFRNSALVLDLLVLDEALALQAGQILQIRLLLRQSLPSFQPDFDSHS